MSLPIESILPELLSVLASASAAVLQAPPGAGKTTLVPLALLDAPWLDGKIVLLEPRRLAARAAAHRMAQLLGERVGETVGYRMRADTRVGPRTRIEVVTEGVLTRMLQRDPALEGVGCVLFDEFHERSLQADLGLALALETQSILRPELRLLVMSATLDGVAVAALLGGAPVIASEGRSFPVEVRWAERRPDGFIEPAVAGIVRQALARDAGDLLVFLPGTGEIRRTVSLLEDSALPRDVRLYPLHGNLPPAEQEAAIAPSVPGTRKVVLATSIAETSLTIEGVRVVVDAGLARVPRFSPRTGMTRLETVRVSRAGAAQRCGRAGRVGPGICYRLWPEHEQYHLLPFATPEILDADLAPLALDLAAFGVSDPAALRWLDPPPAAAFAQARELLGELGALDGAGRITSHGREMAALPTHPRLAHLVLRGVDLGMGRAACALAALLGERDVVRREGPEPPDADLRLRLELALGEERDGRAVVHGASVDGEGLRRVRQEARRLAELVRVARDTTPAREIAEQAGVLLAFAYPDRIAQRRAEGAGRFLLRNGRGAMLAATQPLAREDYLVAAELDDRQREGRIALAAPITLEDVESQLAEQIVEEEVIEWDDASASVLARRRERLGALVLNDAPLRHADPERVAAALMDGLARAGVAALPWSEGARRLRERLAFLHAHDASWPDVSDAALEASLPEWLAPKLVGARRREDVARLDLGQALLERLDWSRRAQLDELAPTHVQVPSGSRLPVDYSDPEAPVLAVRLQELFGLSDTPRVLRGRVPLTLHLLSPAHRPVQVTRDLAGFWRSSYFDVRKDLRGRYPKHHWPDDPLHAAPTSRAKRRRE